MVDLSARVGSVDLATPVVAAAGTYGYGLEYDGLVDWRLVGGVSVKGLSVEPCDGNPAPRMVETGGGMLNAIGLQNIGVEAFVRDKLPVLKNFGPRVIANIWGRDLDEYAAVAERLDGVDGVAALEVNVSCPNRHEWGGLLAADTEGTARIVAEVRKRTTLPLWVKLSPNVTDIRESARAAEGEGADALTVMNTLRAMAIDVETRRATLSNRTGGLSGPAVKPVALLMVRNTVAAVKIPVVGVGGIFSGRDAVEFLIAGAAAVQVGTACLFDPAAPARITREIDALLQRLGVDSVQSIVGTLES